jgi:hypothetical protein
MKSYFFFPLFGSMFYHQISWITFHLIYFIILILNFFVGHYSTFFRVVMLSVVLWPFCNDRILKSRVVCFSKYFDDILHRFYLRFFVHFSLLTDKFIHVLRSWIFIYWFIWMINSIKNGKMGWIVFKWLEFFVEDFLSSHIVLNLSYWFKLTRKFYMSRIVDYVLLTSSIYKLTSYYW